jgi:hypothetical protein
MIEFHTSLWAHSARSALVECGTLGPALWQVSLEGRREHTVLRAERNLMFRTPLDYIFFASILSNVFSILGVAGVVHQLRELVLAFFTYNAIQMVVVFHYFVDICADVGIRFNGQSPSLDSYEQSAAGAYTSHETMCNVLHSPAAVKCALAES